MSRLEELQGLIQEAVQGIARFDRAIVADPDSTPLVLATRSLRNQCDQLQAQFLIEANRLEILRALG
jgi:hypothetical protein